MLGVACLGARAATKRLWGATRPMTKVVRFPETPVPEVRHRCFVYGSLLSGLVNHRWLGDATLVDGDARTVDAFVMVYGGEGANFGVVEGYPYVVDVDVDRPRGPVVGEVYEVSEKTLDTLDTFEEHPREYRRRLVAVDGHEDPAWLYVYEEADGLAGLRADEKGEVYETVVSRDWRAFSEVKEERRVAYASRGIVNTLIVFIGTAWVAFGFAVVSGGFAS